MDYDYVPLPERPPLRWPDGKRVALLITFNLARWYESPCELMLNA